ncbi:MAG: hypothetical protein WCK03_00995 [Candidatus Taylorbacteria bacterium]
MKTDTSLTTIKHFRITSANIKIDQNNDARERLDTLVHKSGFGVKLCLATDIVFAVSPPLDKSLIIFDMMIDHVQSKFKIYRLWPDGKIVNIDNGYGPKQLEEYIVFDDTVHSFEGRGSEVQWWEINMVMTKLDIPQLTQPPKIFHSTRPRPGNVIPLNLVPKIVKAPKLLPSSKVVAPEKTDPATKLAPDISLARAAKFSNEMTRRINQIDNFVQHLDEYTKELGSTEYKCLKVLTTSDPEFFPTVSERLILLAQDLKKVSEAMSKIALNKEANS